MASIPGAQLSLTGASGTQAALTPKSGWFAYVFPRGAWASQDSTGTQITFDSSDIASRFAANNWIQVGISTANIRKVSAVGGNSISVSGSAVTVSEDDRIFIIGNTQPSVTGGSATYIVPSTVVRHRDDDASDRFTNSLVTSDSNGLIQFYATHGHYDVLLQDGNQAGQGYIADLTVGIAEGISTSLASVFGATVTINAALGVTGTAVFGSTVTMNAQVIVGATMTAYSDVLIGNNLYVTGLASITGAITTGGTATFNADLAVGKTAAVFGNFGVTGTATFNGQAVFGSTVTAGNVVATDVRLRRLYANQGTTVTGAHWSISGWGTGSTISIGAGSNDTQGSATITAGTTASINPTADFTFADGAYAFSPWFIAVRSAIASDDLQTTPINGNPLSTTQARITLFGATPTNGSFYFFRWLTIGDKA